MAMAPEQLGRLIDRHSAALVLYARQWCAVPEDVVQEAFVKLMTQRQPPRDVVAWLYRVVRNAAISAVRAQRRRQQHETAAGSAAWFVEEPPDALEAEMAARALEALPIEQREAIVAHLWGGLTFEQIGHVAGCSSSTAHRWYLAGLTALRERLNVPCPNNTRGGN
jgi:RNA polymerase sigma-70 factor (ECF subfamily)